MIFSIFCQTIQPEYTGTRIIFTTIHPLRPHFVNSKHFPLHKHPPPFIHPNLKLPCYCPNQLHTFFKLPPNPIFSLSPPPCPHSAPFFPAQTQPMPPRTPSFFSLYSSANPPPALFPPHTLSTHTPCLFLTHPLRHLALCLPPFRLTSPHPPNPRFSNQTIRAFSIKLTQKKTSPLTEKSS